MKSNSQNYHILVVDDEPLIRESLYEILRIDGYRAYMTSTAEDALSIINDRQIDIIVADMKLPRMNGLELLEHVKTKRPDIEVILITGYGSIETAVEAMKKGAYDYITKPINDQEIKLIIQKIVERRTILDENKQLRDKIAQSHPDYFCGMIGGSEKMQRVYHVVESVASSNATILIDGESGTGKGLVARAIHKSDEYRKDKPFVEVSCGALSETLLESELFGHAKGAFTGAIREKEGRFEFVKGGTIFLDEIDAFSLGLQVKLLRVLQDGVFERVGDNVTRKADMRVIVATNQKLPELVRDGKFREDLYYRINVIAIHLPPLRERKDDLEMLTEYFLERFAKENRKDVTDIAMPVRKIFQQYHWPGNVRELENVLEGAVIMCRGNTIGTSDISNMSRFGNISAPSETDRRKGASLKKGREDSERDLIISILNECEWNRQRTAAKLGVNRTTLYNKMRKYDIQLKRSK